MEFRICEFFLGGQFSFPLPRALLISDARPETAVFSGAGFCFSPSPPAPQVHPASLLHPSHFAGHFFLFFARPRIQVKTPTDFAQGQRVIFSDASELLFPFPNWVPEFFSVLAVQRLRVGLNLCGNRKLQFRAGGADR